MALTVFIWREEGAHAREGGDSREREEGQKGSLNDFYRTMSWCLGR